MKYKNQEEAKEGDVIRWKCWDSDDFVTWVMTGLLTSRGVVYLGGGIDFGMGIGNIMSIDEVVHQSENNDADGAGIERVCSASELEQHISSFKKL